MADKPVVAIRDCEHGSESRVQSTGSNGFKARVQSTVQADPDWSIDIDGSSRAELFNFLSGFGASIVPDRGLYKANRLRFTGGMTVVQALATLRGRCDRM